MKTEFQGKKVTSILGILPECIGYFDDEAGNYTFPASQTLRLKKVMGFNKHRIAKASTTVSDFAVYGLNYMIDREWIRIDDIGAVVVVSLCPDHFVPHISNIVQGKCGISKEAICLDIAQGCCGYIVGLMEAFFLLEHIGDKKVVLINGDVLLHKISPKDRNEYPVMGDAAAISIVENDKNGGPIWLDLRMDGQRGDALKIPAGGFRMPSTLETAMLRDSGDGNIRSLDQMYMDGTEVFNFAMREIPSLISEIHETAETDMEQTEFFLFHQPNKFMLQKLSQKLKIPEKKMPMNLVENFGNPSGASIPLVIALDLRDEFLMRSYKCCVAGFGSGLACGAILMDFGGFEHCALVESEL